LEYIIRHCLAIHRLEPGKSLPPLGEPISEQLDCQSLPLKLSSDHLSLAGRTAIVTGSGRNIGREIALTFARHGAAVVVNGKRDNAAVEAVVAEIAAAGGCAFGIMADVSDREAVFSMVRSAEQRFGAVDIVVSNVGLRTRRPFLELSEEEWRRAIEVNLNPSFFLARAVLPGMQQRSWGRLIHLSGLPIFTGHYPQRVHVLASKSGMHGLSKGLAYEFGKFGITSNVVAPAMIETIRDWSEYPDRDPLEIAKSVPIGRIGAVQDVASACLYLASEAASFITGQTIHVNGGQGMY
jgi:3-oxoacyl-[acyl-carrier protein] reductase